MINSWSQTGSFLLAIKSFRWQGDNLFKRMAVRTMFSHQKPQSRPLDSLDRNVKACWIEKDLLATAATMARHPSHNGIRDFIAHFLLTGDLDLAIRIRLNHSRGQHTLRQSPG